MHHLQTRLTVKFISAAFQKQMLIFRNEIYYREHILCCFIEVQK